MDEKLIQRIYAAMNRIFTKSGNTAVTASQLLRAGIRWNGAFISSEQVREALDIFCERGMATSISRFGGKRMEYSPCAYKATQEKILEAVRNGFWEAQFFDHAPTDEEILAVLNENMRLLLGGYMKLHYLTREGAIARQLVEKLHLECCIIHPGRAVRESWFLKADPDARLASTMAERRRILADLAAKGFVRAKNHRVVPNIPYPSWSVYARSNQ